VSALWEPAKPFVEEMEVHERRNPEFGVDTGVKPSRYLGGFDWPETKWRIGELSEQLKGCTVLLGLDDLDQFKGIEMKFLAFERVLDFHEDWRGKLVLVQVTSPPRGNSREMEVRSTRF
jgi:trehalose 6-phosphate synthase/phosphatase